MTKGNRAWGIWFLGVALLVSTVGGAVWVVHTRADDDPSLLPDLQRPSVGKPIVHSDGVVCRGQVDVDGNIVKLDLPGQIVEILVKENQFVKEGAVLLRADDRMAQNNIRLAEAAVLGAKADLADAMKSPDLQRIQIAEQRRKIEAMDAAMGAAQSRYERLEDLERGKNAAPKDVEAAKHLVAEAKAAWSGEIERLNEIKLKDPANDIMKAQANLNAKEATLEHARLSLDLCSLKAPTDGKILRLNVGKGEMHGPMSSDPAIMFCPDKLRIVRVEVEQEYVQRVKQGMKVIVQDDVSVSGTWHGAVRELDDFYARKRSPELLSFNDLRTIECIVDLDPGQVPLKIGQKVRVIIGASPEH
jgi:multidrug resistance efflux pump